VLCCPSERYQAVVGTVKSFVPRLVARKLVLDLRVHFKRVLFENFHASLVIQNLLEGWVEQRCALSRGVVSTGVHLGGSFESRE